MKLEVVSMVSATDIVIVEERPDGRVESVGGLRSLGGGYFR